MAHPNMTFRPKGNEATQRTMAEAVVREIGFAKLFLTTPDGPRVAHVPLFLTDDGKARFHVARGNAMTRYLADANGLLLIDGPHGYVSPDWYGTGGGQVPTWNYISVEMEGPVRKMDDDGLHALLDDLSAHYEATLAPKKPWTRDKMDPAYYDKLFSAIYGYEMEIRAWRPTFKLSQNKPVEERDRVIEELEKSGQKAIAHMMRALVRD